MYHLSSSSLLFATLLASITASPLAIRDIPTYAKIHRQVVQGSGPRNFTRAMNNACLRHDLGCQVQVHEDLEDISENTVTNVTANEKLATSNGPGSGEVSATPKVHDSVYICPITVGGQTLNLNFDTGSSDLVVYNTALPASETINHTLYDPSKSPTYSNVPGSSFVVSYNDDSKTSGNVGRDTVNVGGISVVGQAVELPTTVSPTFTTDVSEDGVFGLGFQSINGIKPQSQPTWFQNAQSSLQHGLFTANLKANTPGYYQFGVIDHTAYSGDTINYTPVDSSGGYWQFATASGASPGVADTGSSLLFLDNDIVNAYYAQVSGKTTNSQGFIFPCDATLPDLNVTLGTSYIATISGSLINYANVTNNDGYCFGGIQSNGGQNLNVFGDILFNSQFVVFDAGNMQIGFAPHA